MRRTLCCVVALTAALAVPAWAADADTPGAGAAGGAGTTVTPTPGAGMGAATPMAGTAVTPGGAGMVPGRGTPGAGMGFGARGASEVMTQFDADKDGRLSKDEFMKYQEDVFTKADRNGDQSLDMAEVTVVVSPAAAGMEAMRDPARMKQMMEGMMRRLDADADGKVSKSEANSIPRLAERFDEFDTNKDQMLDSTEMQALSTRMDWLRGTGPGAAGGGEGIGGTGFGGRGAGRPGLEGGTGDPGGRIRGRRGGGGGGVGGAGGAADDIEQAPRGEGTGTRVPDADTGGATGGTGDTGTAGGAGDGGTSGGGTSGSSGGGASGGGGGS